MKAPTPLETAASKYSARRLLSHAPRGLDASKACSRSSDPSRVFGAMSIAPSPSVELMAPTMDTSRRPVLGAVAANEYWPRATQANADVQPVYQRSVGPSISVSSASSHA